MSRAFKRSYKSWFGPVFVASNIALLLAGIFLPRYVQASPADETVWSVLRRVVGGVNYPVFWIYDKLSPTNWVATPMDIGVIFGCLLIYWYCQGLLVSFILRIVMEKNTGNQEIV